jgi:hypothetical protein
MIREVTNFIYHIQETNEETLIHNGHNVDETLILT